MEFNNKFISVEAHVSAGEQPVYLMDYNNKYVYTTLISSVHAPDPLKWAITDNSEKVRIPVFAYKTGKEPASGTFACGIQIGMRALEHYQSYTKQRPCDHAVLVVGVERHDLSESEGGDEAYRIYVGISFAREK